MSQSNVNDKPPVIVTKEMVPAARIAKLVADVRRLQHQMDDVCCGGFHLVEFLRYCSGIPETHAGKELLHLAYMDYGGDDADLLANPQGTDCDESTEEES